MKILYGVTGEGMGHATRSRVMLNHLVKDNEVEIVVSGRAHAYLSKFFFNVHVIEGLRMAYENNEVDRSATAWDLITRLPSMIKKMRQVFRPTIFSCLNALSFIWKIKSTRLVNASKNIGKCALRIPASAFHLSFLPVL